MRIVTCFFLFLFMSCTFRIHAQKRQIKYLSAADSICPTIVTQPAGLTVCQGGAITFTIGVTGGTTNNFQWQQNNGSGFLNVINGGIYNGATSTNLTLIGVTVGMNNYQYRCTITSGACDSLISSAAILTINAAPQVMAQSNPASVCSGSGDQVKLSGSGASTYAWTGGVKNNTAFVPVSTDTYTVTGTDSKGCTATSSVLVTINPLPVISANSSLDSVCQGDSVTLSGSGGQIYSWSGGVSNGVPFSPPTTSTYTVTGSDLQGCSSTATATIIVNPIPNVTISASATSICIGSSVTITASGGGTYSWSTGSTSSSINPAPDSTTSYSVKVSNGICPANSGITITVNKPPTLTVSPAQTTCAGTSVTITANGASSYSWTPATGLSSDTAASPSANPPSTTTYIVQGFNGACKAKDSVQLTVIPLPSAAACCAATITVGNSTLLQVSTTPGATYSWSPSTGVLCDTCPSTMASPSQTTTYSITVISGKCDSTSSVLITVEVPCNIFVPNVFSPNGIGMNTKAYVFGLCIQKMDFKIYDKWGNNVFESTDPTIGWDGTYLGQAMDTGDYFYYLNVTTTGNQNIQKKGDINLLR